MSSIRYFLILIIGIFFCGCSVADLDRKLGEIFFSHDSLSGSPEDSAGSLDSTNLSTEQKQKIDAWLKEKGLNRFGDPEGTWYEGGTPLVTASGTIERYEYILGKHEELKQLIK